jgi:NAD(P)-dependent dehydrogenase (short-subunit alcohol dehydrogenase family)
MPTVFITGANRGIGLAFAKSYAASGWRVLAACREPKNADTLKAVKGDIAILALDVTDADQLAALSKTLKDETIDILINNAGVAGDESTEGWLRTLHINSIAPIRVTQALLPMLARSERKLVASITSGMGSIADNTSGGSYAYRSSKAALNAAMKSLSVDLVKRGVSVIVLNPGWVKTDMGGAGARLTAADSVARMRKLIDSSGLVHSGKFFNYDGTEYPW